MSNSKKNKLTISYSGAVLTEKELLVAHRLLRDFLLSTECGRDHLEIVYGSSPYAEALEKNKGLQEQKQVNQANGAFTRS